ncbi:isoprenylcysteine carboxylmethyltransferase family protein [Halalkalicoccus sp. NIPERK01]|uniref:methyltransferase family protein n=1 Tax=Halalkalicoccus sp. NIPERK01 TaxID=3053469 RepID=UPI00256F0FB7|nr:isoprenylcysteine carboxylmethyltransferase family protein [Halalkalicoccus sp. NIPERK01]MDL5361700.1 isoprenylcysteine carboxylmethyltransferase family protein [Halalkalicoccus sp. NIPERK01]
MASIRVALETALFTLVVPGTVAVAVPQLLARRQPRPRLPIRPGVARVLGATSLASGAALYLHTTGRFAAGGGTPSPTDEPNELVTSGLYAQTRNPMYLAVLLVVVGQALVHRSVAVLWWAAGCWIGFHNRVIGYEEPHLARKHGVAYERYCERVPRWLPPLGRMG